MTGELLDIRRIYVEPAAAVLPRGKEILARFPQAQLVEVESHNRIPELYGDETNVNRWVRIKREALVLGVKKTLTARPNGRSADFIAPSTANGCAMACAYCYVPRHKGYSNPITVFANIDKIAGYVQRHAARQGTKTTPNECDPYAWVYDIGENSDCSVDARISDNVRDLVELFRWMPNAKASFATKHVNREMLDWAPGGRTRIRFSLMPPRDAKILDIRTSPIAERIGAIDDFVAAGYEVHLNFSPVVVRDGWLADWADLLAELDARLGPAAKQQLAAEVIFLTHNRELHEVNLGWHPKAEELIWRPDLQQPKRSQNGSWNVRYRTGEKGRHVAALLDLIATVIPCCRVRYAF
ncbi:spore photoproduct lyase family protein [Actinoplanes ianthinogenes]|uniref:Spore photoproduct lyase family protein n=1 Tax=Actinoplanes ianthinogenes TaxID=122358 RepID=A0ABM7LL65_9ACTN|nr:spore photoproduct lyase family protein [Actinoplanes ianthinogenes]BCJ40006.1 spore photoproduct lyase family protein [Actinoplanes ianthinogenes]GGR09616.1 spore photoproduct lyase family protein [Actinoplanes ianthinogenes]